MNETNESDGKFGNDWQLTTNIDEVDDGNGDTIWMDWNKTIWNASTIIKGKQHIYCRY